MSPQQIRSPFRTCSSSDTHERTLALAAVQQQIITCERCPRLRDYCTRVALEKKAAHRQDTYWGRPVPGFGDPLAPLLVLGLAPAAHGANRTGRVFTGDGSGDFLMQAMHHAGFASISTSRHTGDGLLLHGAYIAAAVRCAPPKNKPLPQEIRACHLHLSAEAAALPNLTAIVALGRIAFDAACRLLAERGVVTRPRPPFGHGVVWRPAGGLMLIASYHPSRQNTNTRRLTMPMLQDVFVQARQLIGGN